VADAAGGGFAPHVQRVRTPAATFGPTIATSRICDAAPPVSLDRVASWAHAVRGDESGSLLNDLWTSSKRLSFVAARGDLRHRRRGGRAARDAMPVIGRSASRPPCVPRAESGPVPLLP